VNHAQTVAASDFFNSLLKVYEKLPHGMCTTHADTVNPDLLAFIAE
jgi:non-heme chloroperoxidase